MNIDEIRERASAFAVVDLHGPVDEALIKVSEQKLGFVLPPQYRAFVREFGAGGIGSEEFIGLGGAVHLDLVALKEKLAARQKKIPSHYFPVRSDGFGNYDCIDASHATKDGEYAIVEWLHDDERNPRRVLASSYFEWFDQVLRLAEADEAIDDERS